ncbi:tetratricopeptide repeat protein [Micromonospora sp. NPDC006431]|uniref:tetratricopeptide repeat protein n=1 Tax=Micromonospora sp. NPDC006431 TaxID=3364235 RepID=UPI0036A0EA48
MQLGEQPVQAAFGEPPGLKAHIGVKQPAHLRPDRFDQDFPRLPHGIRRRRSVIQMSSSLRNIGQPGESVRLLTEERERGSDELDDAVSAALALALTSVGREREAVSIAVGALAKHLPRYQRSTANYARLLVEPD